MSDEFWSVTSDDVEALRPPVARFFVDAGHTIAELKEKHQRERNELVDRLAKRLRSLSTDAENELEGMFESAEEDIGTLREPENWETAAEDLERFESALDGELEALADQIRDDEEIEDE